MRSIQIINAEKSDLFDVVAHVAYALPTLTREEKGRYRTRLALDRCSPETQRQPKHLSPILTPPSSSLGPTLRWRGMNSNLTVSQEVHDLVFVLNKADRASEAERSAALVFARHVLETHLKRTFPSIFEVSALDRLEQKVPSGIGSGWFTHLRTWCGTRGTH